MGIAVSIIFVVSVLGIVTRLEKKGLLKGEDARKAIHIGLCHWWFIAMVFFQGPLEAGIVPGVFVVVNYISYKTQSIKSMERGSGKKDLGTVYYAVSLLVLALWTFGTGQPEIGALGIMVMGYGDGFAAVFGEKFGKRGFRIWGHRKTLIGSFTGFTFSLLVIAVLSTFFSLGLAPYQMVLLAFIAMVLEAFTPLGFDNLSVPMGISLISAWITGGL